MKKIFTLCVLSILICLFFNQIKAQCLAAVNGQYPSTTYTPSCSGSQENITTIGYASEYSVVLLTAGTSYTFRSSVATDYITISNAAGTTALAFGITPVSYTPVTTTTFRFYTHTNSSCGAQSVNRTRSIQCSIMAPANDNCSGAVALTVNSGATCTVTTSGTSVAATQSQAACTGTADDDVWYKFIATSTSHIVTVTPTTMSDVVFQVFSGSCASLTSLACIDLTGTTSAETTTLTGLTSGNTYFVRVHSFGNGTGKGTFSVCVTTPPTPPVNDNCSGAVNLTVNSGTTCTVTTSGTSVAATQSQAACTGTADDDVWYKFIATSTSHIVTVTPTTMSDVVFQVFSGSCASLTSLACIDLTGTTSAETTTLTGLTSGNTYFVRVHSFGNGTGQGTFSICITTPFNPCSSILSIASCGTATTATIPSGTGVYNPPTTSCGFITPGVETIYSFTPSASGNYSIAQTANSIGGYIDYFVKAASSGCSGTGWTCLGTINVSGTSLSVALTAGTTYYFMLDPESTAGGSVTFSIACPPTPPANDNCAGAVTITPGTTCTPTAGTTVNATQQLAPTTCSSSTSSSANEVWYKFTADGFSSYTINATTSGTSPAISDLVLGLYSGTCASLTFITCADALATGTETISAGVLAAGTYYYRVYGYNGASGTFTTCVTSVGACTTPNAPSNLVLTPQTGGGSIVGTFNAAFPAPSGYLVIRTTTSTAPTTPTNGTSYTAGTSALGGYVVSTNTTTGFTDNGLSPTTQYWYWIYSYNNTSCSGGPKYSTSYLSGNATTLSCSANALYWAGAGSNIGGTSGTDLNFAANWSSNSISYIASSFSPNTCSDVVMTFSGSGTYTLTQSSNLNIKSISATINSSSFVWLWVTINISKDLNISNAFSIINSSNGDNDHEIDFNITAGNTVCNSVTTNASGNGGASGSPYLVFRVSPGATFTCNTSWSTTTAVASYTSTHIINSGTLTINGTSSLTSSGNAPIYTVVGNSATTTFTGNTVFGSDADNLGFNITYLGGSVSNTTGKFIFKGNMTFGPSSGTEPDDITEPWWPLYPNGTFVFDAPVSQTLKDNTGYYFHIPGNMIIGSANNPTVTIANGNSPYNPDDMFDIYRDLTINGTSTLIIPDKEILNNFSGTGTLSMASGATLKIAGNSSVTPATSQYSEIGSNFPYNFSTRNLNASSIVEYNGNASNPQTVYALPVYGHLFIGDLTAIPSSNATAGGALTVQGNLLINPSAILNGSTYSHSLYGNWTNNGAFNGNTSTIGFVNTLPASVAISGSGVTTFNNLTVNKSSGLVTMNKDVIVSSTTNLTNGALAINDKILTLNGSVIRTNGTFTGSTASNLVIGGTAGNLYFTSGGYSNYLKGVTINSSASAIIANALNITASDGVSANTFGTITVNSGGVLNGNGLLTLKSDANGTSRVAVSTGNLTGDVTLERYIPANRAWRFLSMPFSSSTQSINGAWQEGQVNTNPSACPTLDLAPAGFGTEITYNNVAGTGYDFNFTSNPSIKVWSGSTYSWSTLPNTNSTNIVSPYSAYCLFVRGDRTVCLNGGISSLAVPTVLRAKGILNQISSGATVIRASGTYANNEFVFVGNPYASSINLKNVLTNSLGINQTKFWAWDPGVSTGNNVGAYITYDVINNILAPSGSSYAGGKYAQSGQAFFVQATGGTANVKFNETDKDATEANVYSREAGTSNPVLYANLMIPSDSSLGLADGVAVAFSNKFSEAVNADDASKLWNFDENMALVRDGKTLAIELRPMPQLRDTIFLRLYLRQQPYALKIFSENMRDIIKGKTWLIDKWLNTETEVDLHDTTLYNFTPSADTNSYRNRFMLVYTREEGSVNTAEVNSSVSSTASVMVFPNPVIKNTFSMQMNNLAAGRYEALVYDAKGKLIIDKAVQHAGKNEAYKIVLPSNIASGVYKLVLQNNSAIVKTVSLIVAE